jgi:hypothetical protein
LWHKYSSDSKILQQHLIFGGVKLNPQYPYLSLVRVPIFLKEKKKDYLKSIDILVKLAKIKGVQ